MNYAEFVMDRYTGKNSPAGDLANDITIDPDFPQLTEGDPDGDRETIRSYLIRCGACDGCMAAFKYTWSRYRAYMRKQTKERSI